MTYQIGLYEQVTAIYDEWVNRARERDMYIAGTSEYIWQSHP